MTIYSYSTAIVPYQVRLISPLGIFTRRMVKQISEPENKIHHEV